MSPGSAALGAWGAAGGKKMCWQRLHGFTWRDMIFPTPTFLSFSTGTGFEVPFTITNFKAAVADSQMHSKWLC